MALKYGHILEKGQIMQFIAIHQAKNNFSALIHAVESGEQVVLTRHGKRVARLVLDREPTSASNTQQRRKETQANAVLAKVRSKVRVGKAISWHTARDAGRRV